jgi:hypothetical protein
VSGQWEDINVCQENVVVGETARLIAGQMCSGF